MVASRARRLMSVVERIGPGKFPKRVFLLLPSRSVGNGSSCFEINGLQNL